MVAKIHKNNDTNDTNGNDGMQVKMFQDTLKEGNIILCLNMVVKLSKRLT